MIQEVKMFTVICDNCKKDICEDEDYSAWNESLFVEQIADEIGWKKVEGKHYCTDCYTFDNEGNLILKKL
jgi:hypothetical protein